MIKSLISSLLLCLTLQATAAKTYSLLSPDGNIACTINIQDKIHYSIAYKGIPLLNPSPVSLKIEGGLLLGYRPHVIGIRKSSHNSIIHPVVRIKRKEIPDIYNELVIRFRDNFSLVFRAYNDGLAYRFVTFLPGEIKIHNEELQLNFAADDTVYFPEVDCSRRTNGEDCFHSSYEEDYTVCRLSQLSSQMGFLPLLVTGQGKPRMLFTESDLLDYPGLWMTGTGSSVLKGVFPGYPLKEAIVGATFPQAIVTERADYIAVTQGSRSFPWRVLAICETDAGLIENDLVYRLGGETEQMDFSWIKPGKSQSEWLYGNNIYDVDFRAGYNLETYKYYVDFNARFNTGYLFCDAGWSDVTDVFKLTPDMKMEELIPYAQSKGLKIFLWTSALAMSQQMIPALDKFKEWGVNGVMVDFMDRDDQPMVNFYERLARECAARQMVVNFHGAYKPTGLERRFPNLVTREAVIAFEYSKWSDQPTPEYELTIPFIRMAAGPLDYEPGQMKNAQRNDFRSVDNAPMSQGTRIHQVAMFVVYESLYSKMGGNVADYLREPGITQFMANIPTVWDETHVLDAKVSDYLLLVRKSASGEYYAAAMTDWTPRDLQLDLSFLPPGEYHIEIYQDGINADRYAQDYKRVERYVQPTDRLAIHLAPGGGWVGRIYRK